MYASGILDVSEKAVLCKIGDSFLCHYVKKISRSGFIHLMDGFGDAVGILRDLFIDLGRLFGEGTHLLGDDAEACAHSAYPGSFDGGI